MADKKSSPRQYRRRDAPDIEQILGQCWVAFGHGAANLHVTRDAVATGRNLYLEMLRDHEQKWDEEALHILEFVSAMGRHAALQATEDGSVVINRNHIRKAAVKVQRRGQRVPTFIVCPYCRL